jgi:hypothetical protein
MAREKKFPAKIIWLLIAVFWISQTGGCSVFDTQNPGVLFPPVASTLPPPVVGEIPDARQVVEAYLSAWKNEKYPEMYALLTQVSQAAQSEM